MANVLTSKTIAATYDQILHVDRSGGGDNTTHVNVKDGDNETTFGFTIATDALMMTSDNRLEFGDDGTYIHQSANGVLDLVSDNEVEITGALIDINSTGAMTLDVADDSNITVAGSNKDLSIAVSGGSTQTLTISSAGTGANAIGITASAGGVTMALGGGAGDDFAVDGTTFVIESDNNRVGIGTDSPATLFHSQTSSNSQLRHEVTGADGLAYFQSKNDAQTWSFGADGAQANSFCFGIDAGSNILFSIATDGGVYAQSLLGASAATGPEVEYNTTSKEFSYESSDVALKANVQAIPYGLAEINNLKPCMYDMHSWRINMDEDGNNIGYTKSESPVAMGAIGLIAQEVAEVMPKLLNGDVLKSYKRKELVTIMVKAIQELSAKVTALENV